MRPAEESEAWIALVYTALMLTFHEYALIRNPWPGLVHQLVWAAGAVLCYLPIPALIARAQGRTLADNGLRWPGAHLGIYLAMFAVMLPVLVVVSRDPAFSAVYPFVAEIRNEGFGTRLLVWELFYVAQFFALEAFFRGYLLFTLARHVSRAMAICIAVVPYTMIHFHKPALETVGAVFAGILLAHLALKYRSWIGGAILHALVGVAMDVLATWQRH